MKHYSDDSKKLIKNVVSLVVSALLLAAATVAWFASNATASVERITTSFTAPKEVYYARMAPDSSFLDFAASNDVVDFSTLKIRTRPSTYADVDAYLLAKTGANDWIANTDEITAGASATVDNNGNYICSFVPGDYAAYRVSYVSDGSTVDLSFNSISYSTTMTAAQATTEGTTFNAADVKEKAYKSVYVYSFMRIKAPGASDFGSPTLQDKKTLYQLAYSNGSYQTNVDNILTVSSAANGATVEVYYVIGIPANDAKATHDVIRQAGATISIGLADVG